MRFEQQLAVMATKRALHEWVDKLPETVTKGVILLEEGGGAIGDRDGTATYCFHHIGDVTLAESLYLTKSFEHWLFMSSEERD